MNDEQMVELLQQRGIHLSHHGIYKIEEGDGVWRVSVDDTLVIEKVPLTSWFCNRHAIYVGNCTCKIGPFCANCYMCEACQHRDWEKLIQHPPSYDYP